MFATYFIESGLILLFVHLLTTWFFCMMFLGLYYFLSWVVEKI